MLCWILLTIINITPAQAMMQSLLNRQIINQLTADNIQVTPQQQREMLYADLEKRLFELVKQAQCASDICDNIKIMLNMFKPYIQPKSTQAPLKYDEMCQHINFLKEVTSSEYRHLYETIFVSLENYTARQYVHYIDLHDLADIEIALRTLKDSQLDAATKSALDEEYQKLYAILYRQLKAKFSDQPDDLGHQQLMQDPDYKRLYEALYSNLADQLYDNQEVQLDVACDQSNDFAYTHLYQQLYDNLLLD